MGCPTCTDKCNSTKNSCCSSKPLRYTGPDVSIGLTTGMLMDDAIETVAEFVSTIEFADGVGIDNIVDNGDGTLTFELTDGSTFTTPDLTGPAGATGPAGPTGYASTWTFSNAFLAPPAANSVTFNSSGVSSTSKVYFNYNNSAAVNHAVFLESLNNPIPGVVSGNLNRYGTLKLSLATDPNIYVVFDIITVTDTGTYYDIDVLFADASTVLMPFTNGQTLAVTFIPADETIRTSVYPISNWNMDTTNTFNISIASLSVLGITDYNKIISVDVIIFPDSPGAHIPLDIQNSGVVQGGVVSINSTNIVLNRLTGGDFDSAVYSGAGDRGYALIKHLK